MMRVSQLSCVTLCLDRMHALPTYATNLSMTAQAGPYALCAYESLHSVKQAKGCSLGSRPTRSASTYLHRF